MEEARYRYLRDKSLYRFVNQLRQTHGQLREGSPVPKELAVVVSCDGDIGQVRVMSDPSRIENEDACK